MGNSFSVHAIFTMDIIKSLNLLYTEYKQSTYLFTLKKLDMIISMQLLKVASQYPPPPYKYACMMDLQLESSSVKYATIKRMFL